MKLLFNSKVLRGENYLTMKEYFHKTIGYNTVRAALMDQIEDYVKVILKGNIQQIPYSTYVD